jgi:uncharacterized protein (DUF1697 family)
VSQENMLEWYVALLRGINVGGKNLIRMPDLAACFSAQGLADVRTYIQSGNVLFRTPPAGPDRSQAALELLLGAALSAEFHYEASLTLRSAAQMRTIVAQAPAGFGSQPEAYRYDVIYLISPLSAADALAQVSLREGVDQAFAGEQELYFSRLISRASQSRLSRIVNQPVYQYMTIRNWNTTTRLLELMAP